jgi:amidase
MKPSRGTVSSTGIIPLVRFQDSAGPIARSVTDAAILLEAIDSTTTDYSASLKPDALKDIPVGILRADISSPDNKLGLDRIDAGLLKAGALPRDTSLSGKVDLLPVVFLGLWQDSIAYMASTGLPVRSVPDLIAYNKADAPRRIPRGQNLLDAATQIIPAVLKDAAASEADAPALYEKLALEARTTASNALDETFKSSGASLLVSLANRHSEFYATAGFPAITVPLGLSPDGTPNGITFIARPGEDASLLARAFAFEQATRLRANPPE